MAKESKRASASTVRKELGEARKRWGWSPSDIISLLRGGGSASKGSDYERDMCRRLSRWWTHEARDDVFWRSSGSGARAKVRGRGGADTLGQHGDVAATDPIGAPLIDLLTIEIKRGYSEYTFQDIVDRLPTGGLQEWENFISQTLESYEMAGSFAWLMITRRDRRTALAWVPTFLMPELRAVGAFQGPRPCPFVGIKADVRDCDKRPVAVDMMGTTLDNFLAAVTPEQIVELSRKV